MEINSYLCAIKRLFREYLLNAETQHFIRSHINDDVRQLALKGVRDPLVDLPYALQQIAGWQKARQKLPSWAATEGIVYPPHLSLEQCSSEQTARYKASIAGEGACFVDLTAGLGVDAAWIARRFRKAVCVEQQAVLCEIASHNFSRLGLSHVSVVNGDGIDYLHGMKPVDLLYIDPARRDEHGGRTYGIADCTPNVLEMLDEMTEKAQRVLIKLSPMLDWRKVVKDLEERRRVGENEPRVGSVHIVSVDNECKELLVVMGGRARKLEGEMFRVVCVNLLSDGSMEHFEYAPSALHLPPSTKEPSTKGIYLYEPNASIMKAGCFNLLSTRFGLTQLDTNSHLFVADHEVSGFPGRRFVIEHTTSLNKRELKAALAGVTKANISVRNFPLSVAELRKRLKLQDGGDVYIFATTVAKRGHQLFICRKKS